MNREVYILSGFNEIYLGTVGEITGTAFQVNANEREGGIGISVAAAFSDLISTIAFDNAPRTFTIELRDPGT